MVDWPPDYQKTIEDRIKRLVDINQNDLHHGAFEYYRDKPIDFINHWMVTYDPRNGSKGIPSTIPFILFPAQIDLICFLKGCSEQREHGLIEKSRDMGATFLCCAYSIWLWIYNNGSSIGWGSRKEKLVDEIGNIDSIMEKMREMIDYLPDFLTPKGYSREKHANFMKIINPVNGSIIKAEGGRNVGRGGRSTLYFVDESAFLEHPEMVEAALGDNTDVRIDLSSVNGTNNVFYRKRMAGVIWEPDKEIESGMTRVFIMDWRDHPGKTQEWYDKRKSKADREGMSHVFAQEVDRDYGAAIAGVIIPTKWVKAAIDAHIKLGIDPHGKKIAGLDVADDGQDANGLVLRDGILAYDCDEWVGVDTTITAQKTVGTCKRNGVREVQYDCIGVGAGVKGESNRLKNEGVKIEFVPWNAGGKVLTPESRVIPNDRESPKHKDVYANLKAQGWYAVRTRFEKTYKAITHGEKYEDDELISICSKIPFREQLVNELSQPTSKTSGKGLLMIDKKPNGAMSPNLADAFIQAYHPIEQRKFVML